MSEEDEAAYQDVPHGEVIHVFYGGQYKIRGTREGLEIEGNMEWSRIPWKYLLPPNIMVGWIQETEMEHGKPQELSA